MELVEFHQEASIILRWLNRTILHSLKEEEGTKHHKEEVGIIHRAREVECSLKVNHRAAEATP